APAVLDRDGDRGDGRGAAGVIRRAGEARGERRAVVDETVRRRGRDGRRRVRRVDDDVLLAADRARAADGRQGERRVVPGGVLDRPAVQRERGRGGVVEVGRVVRRSRGVRERERRGAG